MDASDSEDPRNSKDKSSMELGQMLSRMERNTHKFVRWHSKETKNVEALNYDFFVEERRKYSPWTSEAAKNHDNQLKISKDLRKSLSDLSKGTHAFIRKHDTLANRAEYLQYTDLVRNRDKQNAKDGK